MSKPVSFDGRRDWQPLESIEDASGTHCVDTFVRADGSFGFELFRKDPEDQGHWTMLGHHQAARFATHDDAKTAARKAASWLR